MRLLSNLHVKDKPAVLPDRAIRRQSHYFIYRPRISLGDKGGRCVGLTTLLPLCGDCLEIWEPQPTGNLQGLSRPVMGLLYLYLYLLDARSKSIRFSRGLPKVTLLIATHCRTKCNTIVTVHDSISTRHTTLHPTDTRCDRNSELIINKNNILLNVIDTNFSTSQFTMVLNFFLNTVSLFVYNVF